MSERGPRRGERGFTVIEVLIALLVLLAGMAGILSLQMTSVQATGFSRHATEASILAEDKIEWLRTQPLATLVSGSEPDPVDSRGVPDPGALYQRSWVVTPAANGTNIVVNVTWVESGDTDNPPYTVTLATRRVQ
jgi:type IV pilus assembly protein PilV